MEKTKRATCPFPGCGRRSEHSGEHRAANKSRKPKSNKIARRGRTKLKKAHEDFCQFYADSDNATQSAIFAGLSGQWGRLLVHRPEIVKRIAEIREEFSDELAARRVEKALLSEGFTDQQVMQIMVSG